MPLSMTPMELKHFRRRLQILNITDRADSEENIRYEKTKMQREQILNRLREQGCRITKQRLTLLDIKIGRAHV